MESIVKYPRTQHIEGSRMTAGDEDLSAVKLSSLAGHDLVIEEKLDGANAAIRFTKAGELRLQSRGHYLTGGYRERHFDLFKTWASAHKSALWQLLGDRLIAYGEWLYAKHTVFYDQLPHYFLEFDVLDVDTGVFLSTDRRHALLSDSPIASVPVLSRQKTPRRRSDLDELVGHSLYKSERWRDRLAEVVRNSDLDRERAIAETDPSDHGEGLYIKAEHEGQVTGRYKYVRASFLTAVKESGSHWLDRPIVPNQLAHGIDIFEATVAAAEPS